jgi:hypothetical protein
MVGEKKDEGWKRCVRCPGEVNKFYVVKSSRNEAKEAIREKTEREPLNSNRQERPR